jgi:tyrosyl-tRNA synthetase
MSKSLGNTIGLTDPPEEMYGRAMSIPDALLPAWIRLLGRERWDDLMPAVAELEAGRGDPFQLKQALAERLVERFHGQGAAKSALAHFQRVVRDRELPDEVPEARVALQSDGRVGLLDVMRETLGVSSNAEARRLVQQGAVELDGARVADPKLRLGAGSYLLRAGRRRFARVRVEAG